MRDFRFLRLSHEYVPLHLISHVERSKGSSRIRHPRRRGGAIRVQLLIRVIGFCNHSNAFVGWPAHFLASIRVEKAASVNGAGVVLVVSTSPTE